MRTHKTGANKGILVIYIDSLDEWPDAVTLAAGKAYGDYPPQAWDKELETLEREGEVEIAARYTETGRPVHVEWV